MLHNSDAGCVCCQQCPIESSLHLLFLCPYAVAIWFHVANLMSNPIFKIASSIDHEIFRSSWTMVRGRGMKKREWATSFLCVAWNIWKNRNAIIFREQGVDAKALAYRCLGEMRLWLQYC